MQPHHRSGAAHRRSRLVLSIGLAALALAALGGVVQAKGGGLVRVDPPIDLGADPGSTIDVRFEPFQVLDGGTELAWTGTPMVVRVFPAGAGATMTRIKAVERPAGSGRYAATITVPASGLARIEIGLVGESCVNGECTISDLPFELTDGSVIDTAQAHAPANADPANADPAGFDPRGADPGRAAPAVISMASQPPSFTVPAVALVAVVLGLALGVAALVVSTSGVRRAPRSRRRAPGR